MNESLEKVKQSLLEEDGGQARRSSLDKLREQISSEDREQQLSEKRTVTGQAGAALKNIPRTALSLTGGTARGVAAITLPADKVQESGLYRAGESLESFAQEQFNVPEEYEGKFVTDLAGGIASMGMFMLTGGVGGSVTRGAAKRAGVRDAADLEQFTRAGQFGTAAGLAGPAGADEAYQRAIEHGESPEDAQGHARTGVVPGLVQIANINFLLRPLPQATRKKLFEGHGGRILLSMLSEATVEGAGAVGQNFIAQSYDPETGLFDDAAYRAMIGGLSAGGLQAGRSGLSRLSQGDGAGGKQPESVPQPETSFPPEIKSEIEKMQAEAAQMEPEASAQHLARRLPEIMSQPEADTDDAVPSMDEAMGALYDQEAAPDVAVPEPAAPEMDAAQPEPVAPEQPATRQQEQGLGWLESPEQAAPATSVPDADKPVLQNRDRSTPAMISQMRSIARNPDYTRLSFSRDFTQGAPVVEPGAELAPQQLGREEVAATGAGRKIPVQYAVVEADQLLASNDINGSMIPDYEAGAPGRSRAIAGNGRVIGLQQAYKKGAASQYRDELAADAALHGIDAAVIQGMSQPVLVRIMPQEEVTANIGDESNVSGTAQLSPAETARNDMRRFDLEGIEFTDDGRITDTALRQFVQNMPESEWSGLLDGDRPNRVARDRLENAIFAAAYESDALIELQAQATDTEARTVMQGLLIAAPKVARLRGHGEYDIRDLIAEAASAAINARRSGRRLSEFIQQIDLEASEGLQDILQMMADNIRSARRIGESLSNLADTFYNEASRPSEDMFGAVEKTPVQALMRRVFDDQQAGQEGAGDPGGQEADAGRDVGQAAQPGEQAGLQRAERAEPTEPEGQAQGLELTPQAATQPDESPAQAGLSSSEPDDFALQAQTEQALTEQDRQRRAAEEAEAARQRDEEQRAQADAEVDDFLLTGSALPADEAAARGQADIFSQPEQDIDEQANKAATSPENDTPAPAPAQIEAGNYQKGHVRLHGLDITIENPKGSTRSGVAADGTRWERELAHHYGYFKRSEGADGEHIDVFVGPREDSDKVFVIDQVGPDGTFDEHKVMLGFSSKAAAKAGYRANYDKGWKVGPVTEMTVEQFREWLETADTTQPVSDDAIVPREMTEDGRAADGRPIKPGNVFITSSGRTTTPYPQQKSERFASRWLIENATEEARSRGDDFNAPAFENATIQRDGALTPSDRESMTMYLFGEQPDVPRRATRPLAKGGTEQQATARPAEDMFGAPARSESLEELRRKLQQMDRDTLKSIAKLSGLIQKGSKSKLVDRLALSREAADTLRGYESFDAARQAVQRGDITKERLHQWYLAVKKGSGSDNSPVNYELNLHGLRRWGLESGAFYMELDQRATAPPREAAKEQQAETVERADGGTTKVSLIPPRPDTKSGQAKDKTHYRVTSTTTVGSVTTPLQVIGHFETQAEAERAYREEIARAQEQAKAEPAAAQQSDWGDKNTVFTKDAAEKARDLLRKKGREMRSGIDPEMVQAGVTLAGYHIEAGARRFTDYARAMVDDLGDWVTPYLRSWYEGVRYYPGFDSEGMDAPAAIDAINIEQELANVSGSTTDLAGDRQGADAETRLDTQAVSGEPGGDTGAPGQADGEVGSQGRARGSDTTADEGGATTGRARSDSAVRPGAAGADGSTTQRGERGRSSAPGEAGSLFGSTPNRDAGRAANAAVDVTATENQRREAQKAAESIPVEVGNLANIRETLPMLLPQQQEDVEFAERRLLANRGHGVMFTNGTGTGKTFTGLGTIKRYARQGRDSTIIVVPNDKIAADWAKAGKMLELDISPLADTRDNGGSGIVVTTYANFYQNKSLVHRDWDLVVFDESHYLLQRDALEQTRALTMARALTSHPRGHYARHRLLHAEEYARVADLSQKIHSNNKIINLPDTMDQQVLSLQAENRRLEAELDPLEARLKELKAKDLADTEANWAANKTDALFLSATPFAYRKSLDYAEGWLFDYGAPNEQGRSYNRGNAAEQFFVSRFGYRMRYNKLTEPGPEVDLALMEREFSDWLRDTGAVRSRLLEVEQDYDRRFYLVDDAVGAKIDEGMAWMRNRADQYREEDNGDMAEAFSQLEALVMANFDYLRRAYLLEAIKAKHMIPVIRQHMEMGRKVVVFHDYNKGGGFHPFRLSPPQKQADNSPNLAFDAYQVFARERNDLLALDFSGLGAPIDQFEAAFGSDALLFNGRVPKAQRRAAVEAFNDDNSGNNLIVVQSDAGREGVSLHDTSGKHQRVLINIGLPVKPIASIQTEGRIYRTFVQSNAIQRYVATGLNMERWAVASKLADRASTAENLAMGSMARGLKDAFVMAYEAADEFAPGHSGEGAGGKELDRQLLTPPSEFDKAKTYYYGQQKIRARRDQRAGADYFATPEPVGLKMVEWAGLRPGENALEPSAGHGAILRWMGDGNKVHFVEPSDSLASQAAMNAPHADYRPGVFEDLHLTNKYDAIVMNPPFGQGGKTAADHVRKAIKHLRDGGRIVALIPRGPAADKRFETLLGSEDASEMRTVAEINMPAVTFDRAGTKVASRILVLEKQADEDRAGSIQKVTRDMSNAEDINELFDRIEDMSVPGRTPAPESPAPAAAAPAAAGAVSAGMERYEFAHSQTGEQVYLAIPQEHLGDRYRDVAGLARDHGGWWNRFARGAAKKGFAFKSEAEREAFLEVLAPPGGRHSVSEARPSAGLSASGLRRNLRSHLGELADRVKVVQSVTDLPGRGKGLQSLAGKSEFGGRSTQELRAIDIEAVPFAELQGVAGDLLTRVTEAYAAGDITTAEALDPLAEAALDRLEHELLAREEVSTEEAFGEQGEPFLDSAPDVDALLATTYYEHFIAGRSAFSSDEDAIANMRENVRQAGQSGLREGVTDQEILTAAREAYELKAARIRAARGRLGLASSLQGRIEGMYDPTSGEVYLVADNIASEDRAAWVSWHELWHRGARSTDGFSLTQALNKARLHKTVRQLADAIQADRGMGADQRMIAIEEALAEFNAADETGNYDALESRYGISVPMGMRAGIRGHIGRFLDTVRAILRKLGVGKNAVLDSEVLAIIRGARAGYDGRSETLQRPHVAEARADENRAAQGDLFDQAPAEARLEYFQAKVKAELVETGSILTENIPIRTIEDLVRFLRPYADFGRETFLVVPVDENNQPLGILRHTTGALDSASVYPEIVAGDMALAGATRYWIAHNHPSGNPNPSDADVSITERLRKTTEPFGIHLRGHAVLGQEGYTVLGPDGRRDLSNLSLDGTPYPKQGGNFERVRTLERIIVERAPLDIINATEITDPSAAKRAVAALGLDGGADSAIIFLNNKQNVVDVYRLGEGVDPTNLKAAGVEQEILRRAASANAISAVVVSPTGKGAKNLANIIHAMGLSSLDALAGRGLESLASTDSLANSGLFFSVAEGNTDAKRRERAFLEGIGSQPIDRMFRLPFDALGWIDSHGRLKGGKWLDEKARSILTEWKPNPEGSFDWMNPMLEKARAGLIDRYGLTPEYRQRWRETESEIRRRLGEAYDLFESTLKGMSMAEAKALQSVMTEGADAGEAMNRVAEPIRRAIDDMGRELVNLGLLDAETFERNRATYLHRLYIKHEAQFTGLSGWVHKMGNKRRRRIQGNALRKRGIDAKVTMQQLMKGVPQEWWRSKLRDGQADKALKGAKFKVFERLEPIGEGTIAMDGLPEGGPARRRVMERHYWPTDRPVPAKYQAWEERGTWEAIDIKGGKVQLWRDYTKAERERMGEIVDARYTIVRTFETLSSDIAMGRFFSDIAKNPEWFNQQAPDSDQVVIDAGQARFLDTFAGVDWVKVPTTPTHGGDGARPRWGALAGGYVRAEIWRDLNELDKMHVTGTWRPILNQWKLNKTARSPVVHMNNVMSNFMLMDLADVRLTDFIRGVQAYASESQEYRDALEYGAFESSFIQQEIRKRILQPVLDDVLAENIKGGDSFTKRLSVLSRFGYSLTQAIKKADSKMVQFYQVEDEIFRMATYMRRLDLGDSPSEAAAIAREQFLDYDIRAPWVNAARRSVLPFISYTYRAVPVVAQSIVQRPWKLAKYFTLAYLAQALAYELAPGDEDEERRTMRDEAQGYTWVGVPRMLRMPYRDANGNPAFLDARRWIPAGDVFDMNQGQSALPIPAPLQFGGPLMLAAELVLNKQAFTGREIIDPQTADALDVTRGVSDWAWKSWMPSAAWIPGSFYWDRVGTAIGGGRDQLGRPYSVPQAISSSVGIKLQPHDVDMGYYYRSRDLDFTRRRLQGEARNLQRDLSRGLINQSRHDREMGRVIKKMERLEGNARRLQGRE